MKVNQTLGNIAFGAYLIGCVMTLALLAWGL